MGNTNPSGAVIENSPSDGTACRRFVTLMDVFTPVNVMVAVSAPDPIVIELVPSPVHGWYARHPTKRLPLVAKTVGKTIASARAF